ncbi:MAG: tetraacyldisaccharide 4'-kinase [Rikenellaceae bacterium]
MFKDIILTILSWFYQIAIAIRHALFNWRVIKSREFDVPIICIGNITVGGTGKTPMCEMIVNYMSQSYTVAVISRGYGRRTKGFLEVSSKSHYRDVGDEPLQIKLKFPNAFVAVCEDRVEGIERLLAIHPEISLIVMDDGFQHRYVKPKINVIMVDATRPIQDDHMLPYGRLRDLPSELHRANYFVLTKCPESMSPLDRRIQRKVLISVAYQEVYFTRFESFRPKAIFPEGEAMDITIDHNTNVIAMSGIGNPVPFSRAISAQYNLIDNIVYNDHHVYKVKDLALLESIIKKNPSSIIITTEKDAVKLMCSQKISQLLRERLFYVPINISFIDESRADFLQKLKADVEAN